MEVGTPAEAAMTSPFGNRPEIGDVHKGIDFGAQCGAPIYAAGNGKVVFAQKATDGANGVIIQHDGVATMYWHLQDGSLKVSVGDEVKLVSKSALAVIQVSLLDATCISRFAPEPTGKVQKCDRPATLA